jgi:hypothetical protein
VISITRGTVTKQISEGKIFFFLIVNLSNSYGLDIKFCGFDGARIRKFSARGAKTTKLVYSPERAKRQIY